MNLKKLSLYFASQGIDFDDVKHDTFKLDAATIAIKFSESLDPSVLTFTSQIGTARVFISLPNALRCFRPDLQVNDAFKHMARAIIHHEYLMPPQGFNYTIGTIFKNLESIYGNGGKSFIDQFIDECISTSNHYMFGRILGIYGSAVPNVFSREIIPHILSRRDIDDLVSDIKDKDLLGNFCIKHGIETLHRHLPSKHKGQFLEDSLGL